MRELVPRFLRALVELRQSGLAQLITLGETLHSWSEQIARMWRFTRSNGITEGFYDKMEILSRQAYAVGAHRMPSSWTTILDPLIKQLLPVNYHQGVHFALGNQPRRNSGLAEVRVSVLANRCHPVSYDHTGLVVRREAHGLCLVEFGILKRR